MHHHDLAGLQARLADPSDVDTLFEIRTSVKENHLSLEQLTALGITREFLERKLFTQHQTWLAEVEGVAAGFSMVDDETACVFAAFVKPEWEGRGVGRRLMEEAESFLLARHETIWLETRADSRACGFYQKRGWRLVEAFDDGDARLEKQRNWK